MAGEDAPLELRVDGMMQMLMVHLANGETPAAPEPRDVVDVRDALDAVLQIAAVIDEHTQPGAIPRDRGVHAGAMFMVLRDYLRPLPVGLSRDDRDRLTEDPQGCSAGFVAFGKPRGYVA